jgi:hypothetical protein
MANWYNSISGNANAFAIGNLNQSQVSPFAPAAATDLTALSTQISTCCGHLSSIVDFTTYTLSISTIVPVATNPSQTITMQGSTININANQIIRDGEKIGDSFQKSFSNKRKVFLTKFIH